MITIIVWISGDRKNRACDELFILLLFTLAEYDFDEAVATAS